MIYRRLLLRPLFLAFIFFAASPMTRQAYSYTTIVAKVEIGIDSSGGGWGGSCGGESSCESCIERINQGGGGHRWGNIENATITVTPATANATFNGNSFQGSYELSTPGTHEYTIKVEGTIISEGTIILGDWTEGCWQPAVVRHLEDDDCPCSCRGDDGAGGSAGSGGVGLGSAKFSVYLGKAIKGKTAGLLSMKVLHGPFPATPALLRDTVINGVTITKNGQGWIQHTDTGISTMDVVVNDSYSFDMIFRDLSGQTNAIWNLSNPNKDINHFRAVKTVNGSTVYDASCEWNTANQEWTLSKGFGSDEIHQTFNETEEVIGETTNRIKTFETRDSDNNLCSVVRETYHLYDNNRRSRLILREVFTDEAGVNPQRTEYNYCWNSAKTGSYARVSSVTQPDSSWKMLEYDHEGLLTNILSSWLDEEMPAQPIPDDVCQTVRSYDPALVDPLDDGTTETRAPRMVVDKIKGIVVGRNFYSYYTNAASERVEIIEKCRDTNASYGDSSNERTVTTYQAPANEDPKTISHPNGLLDTYTYEWGTFVIDDDPSLCMFIPGDGTNRRVTVTHGTTTHPEGIPYLTTRDVTIEDDWNTVLMSEDYVCTDTGFERVGWVFNYTNENHRAIKTVHSDGTYSETAWRDCCFGKDWEIDRNGIENTYVYDDFGRMLYSTKTGTEESSGDIETAYTYNANGRRLTTTRLGITNDQSHTGLSMLINSNTFDLAGRIVNFVGSDAIVSSYEYSPDGRTTTVIRAGVTNVTANYRDGRAKFTYIDGVIETAYEYGVNLDGTQWTKTYTGPNGITSPRWTKTTTDLLTRTIIEERPAYGGGTVSNTFLYSNAGHLIKSISPGMAPTLYEYNELGELLRTALDLNTNGTIDLAGPDRVTESLSEFKQCSVGSTSQWFYVNTSIIYPVDSAATPVTNSIRKTRLTGFSQSAISNLQSEITSADILGNQTTTRTYLDRENKTITQTVDHPDSTNNTVSITINGLLQSTQSKTGVETTYTHDPLERRCSSRSVSGISGERTIASITHYNSKGQIAYTEDAASNRTSYAYDPATGQRTSVTNALGNVVYYEYDNHGRVLKTWGDTVYPVKYSYDEYGAMNNMKTYRGGTNWSGPSWPVSPGNEDITEWWYDYTTGLLETKFISWNDDYSYAYSPDGKLIARLGNWGTETNTTYSYDPLDGSLTNINYNDSTPSISFTYDRLGRQKTIVDAQGIRTFAYDPATLSLTNETIVAGGVTTVLARAQDALGRASGIALFLPSDTSNPSYRSDYGYSGISRFHSVSSSVQSVSSVVEYSYLPGSDLISGHTLSSTPSALSVSRTYEPNRDLITQVKNQFDTTTISQYNYTNDEIGRRTQRIDTMATATTNTFAYNTRSELTNAVMGTDDFAFDYDPIGNRRCSSRSVSGISTTNNYTANSMNQYSSINGTNLTYDCNGNMLTHNDWTYTWNGENRLIQASNSITVLTFAYDYMGRRFSKTTTNYEQGTTNRTQFVYDGWAIIRETSDSITNSFVYGLDLSGSMQGAGTIGGILSADLNGTQAYYCYDANGNVTDLVDTNGTTTAHYEYDPFGNTTVKTGTLADANPFRFSTKYLDDETGLYYYGYRYYSPELGRWPSRDPIVERGGINLYCFVRNESIGMVDILGLELDGDYDQHIILGPMACDLCMERVILLETRDIRVENHMWPLPGGPYYFYETKTTLYGCVWDWSWLLFINSTVHNGPQHYEPLLVSWFMRTEMDSYIYVP